MKYTQRPLKQQYEDAIDNALKHYHDSITALARDVHLTRADRYALKLKRLLEIQYD